MKPKPILPILIAIIVILVILFSFYVYYDFRQEEVKEKTEEIYTSEEVVEGKDIIPDESAEVPTIEEMDKDVDVLHQVTVEIMEGKFYPDKIMILPGTTVVWVNKDEIPHKLVAYDRVFYGPRMQLGDKYSFTFMKIGTHTYFDAVFPKQGRGEVIVQEEPLPITGGVIGVNAEESNGKFALIFLLFIIMVFGLTHGMYTKYNV
jgi:plastocyanin